MKPGSLFLSKSEKTYAGILRSSFMPCFASGKYIQALLFTFILLLSNLFAFGQLPGDNLPVGFRGAELYADIKSDGKLIVHLKKYYDCGFEQAGETEKVSLFETETSLVRDPIVLKKESTIVQENNELQTPANPSAGCVSVSHYVAEVDLGLGRANYDISWGYCCLSTMGITNLNNEKSQGISLVVSVQNDGALKNNTAASLKGLPAFVMQINTTAAFKIILEDKENDNVEVYLTEPFSAESIHPVISSGHEADMLVQESIITNKPPFKSLDYAKGFSKTNPLNATIFSIEANTGTFKYLPTQIGKYITAITIKEKRDNKTISEHQCVFIIDVQ